MHAFNDAQVDKYGYLVPDDLMRCRLLESLDGCYATEPLLVCNLPAWRNVHER